MSEKAIPGQLSRRAIARAASSNDCEDGEGARERESDRGPGTSSPSSVLVGAHRAVLKSAGVTGSMGGVGPRCENRRDGVVRLAPAKERLRLAPLAHPRRLSDSVVS